MSKTFKQVVYAGLHDALRSTNPDICDSIDDLLFKGACVQDIVAHTKLSMRHQGIDPRQHQLTIDAVLAYASVEKEKLNQAKKGSRL